MAFVEYEKQGHLVTIRLRRPDKKNALTPDMMNDLRDAWIAFMEDDGAWLGLLTAAGGDFCAGADFTFLQSAAGDGTGLDLWLDIIKQDPLFRGEVDKPTISAISGYCLGAGLVIALNTDLRVCTRNAKLQIAELALGFPLLIRDNLPHAIAAELNCGLMITGQRAYEMGLANRIVADDRLMEGALELADELLSSPPLGIYHGLKLARALKHPEDRIPADQLIRLQEELQKTEDFREALAAIREKRKPVFRKR